MKALIEIDGDWQGLGVIPHVSSKYKNESHPYACVDTDKVRADGYDFTISLGPNLKNIEFFGLENSPDVESFVLVMIEKPSDVFDDSLVNTNTPIVVARKHTLFGWMYYALIVTCRKLNII